MATFNLKYLLSKLSASRIKEKNPALHETVKELIDVTQILSDSTNGTLGKLSTKVQGDNLPNKYGGLEGAQYLTVTDQTAVLPNSIILKSGPGTSIVVSGTTATITSSGSGELLTEDGSSPPVALTTEDGSDYLYEDLV